MILYAIQYKGPSTSNEWSIVSIHIDRLEALYWKNRFKNRNNGEYEVIDIDTDKVDDYGMIYYYENN